MTTSAPRRGNRIAVVLSVAALVTSVGIAGGPAIARAINADTVDHKHAVGAQASVKQRKGKLVATDKRTGRLPDDIIGTAPNALHAASADAATRAASAATADAATAAQSAADADRLAGRPASAYLTSSDVDQVVGLGGAPTLPAAGVTTSTASFTTTKRGRLLVDFTGSGQLQCPSSSFVRWWIQVDGTPIVASSLQLGEAVTISFDYAGFPAIHLAGITADAVEPGDHTVALAGGCTSGASGGSATSGTPGVGTVTVLASGQTGSSASLRRGVVKPAAGTACVMRAARRTCR